MDPSGGGNSTGISAGEIFLGVNKRVLCRLPRNNNSRKRKLTDGTHVKWCREYGYCYDNFRAGNPVENTVGPYRWQLCGNVDDTQVETDEDDDGAEGAMGLIAANVTNSSGDSAFGHLRLDGLI